ncbi:MAG: AAA family ATPase [Deltaproteobacteria bacterium]|nr:AAA family ATPase [Deltaproteobacteria bacterium]
MYLHHYGLADKPFQINPDPRFLWLGEKHREALAFLRYGLLSNQGFLLLTGDVGTGKTTLINALLNELDDNSVVANLTNPNLNILEFYNFVANSFGIRRRFASKVVFLRYFSEYLARLHSRSKYTLLIIDESHTIPLPLLEEIRLLSNLEKNNTRLLNIFFVGQNEFNDILLQESCRALRQRISYTFNIKPLTLPETREYIRYRLTVAGASRDIFSEKAVREIYAYSAGYPRLINIVCDHALLSGYVSGVSTISSRVVRKCSEELRLPGEDAGKISGIPRSYFSRIKYPPRRMSIYAMSLLLVILTGWLLLSDSSRGYVARFQDFYSSTIHKLAPAPATRKIHRTIIRKAIEKPDTPGSKRG